MFDKTYCISLNSRPERWKRFMYSVPLGWPFGHIHRAWAIDGKLCPPFIGWSKSAGAWGCLRSHIRILEDVLNAGLSSVLVFEDDALLCDDFVNKAVDFMYHVPRDWCMLYFGGRHLRKPQSITDRVDRALKVERTHAYALRGDFLRTVYQAMNDTPLVKEADEVFWNLTEEAAFENEPLPVYCPTRWLVAQDEGDSDITPIHKGVRWGDDD